MTFDEANDYIQSRQSKLTTMGSREISRSVPPKIRAHCFYSAHVASDRVLSKIREVSDAFSSGQINQSEARLMLRRWLRSEGLDSGTAKITNLASKARVDLILTQNKRMAVAVGKYAQDRDPVVEERFPSWKYHCGRNARVLFVRINYFVLTLFRIFRYYLFIDKYVQTIHPIRSRSIDL